MTESEGRSADPQTAAERPSWLALPLAGLIWLYQRLISPLIPPSCRFTPSCSAYAITALRRYGPIKGSWLAVRRLLRCHPWNPGGVDHVPLRDTRPTRPHFPH